MRNNQEKTNAIIDLLKKAYNAELETVMNYLANAANLEGVRAKEIKESLAKDVGEELGHAQRLANRIHVLSGIVPGSQALEWTQTSLQPPADTTDVVAVIKGVIDAETSAIETYAQIIEACEGYDYVTQDLVIALKGDEEEHKREFEGFLREYEG